MSASQSDSDSGTEPEPDTDRNVRITDNGNTMEATRSLYTSGGSTVIAIPPEMLDTADLENGDDLVISLELGNDGELRLRRASDVDEE